MWVIYISGKRIPIFSVIVFIPYRACNKSLNKIWCREKVCTIPDDNSVNQIVRFNYKSVDTFNIID